MSDRLNELRRQRALVQEQAAWLDREIARESGGPAQPSPTRPTPTINVQPNRPSSLPPTADAGAIIARYQNPGHSVHADVKRSLFLLLFAALGLLGLVLTAFWFFRYRH